MVPVLKSLLDGKTRPSPLPPVYEDRYIGRPISAGPMMVLRVRAEYPVEMSKDLTISERELATARDQDDLIRQHMVWAYREMGVDTTQDLPLGYLPRRQRLPLTRSPAYGGAIFGIDPAQERSQTVGQFVRWDTITNRWVHAEPETAEGVIVQAGEGGTYGIQTLER
jgi:hypothetical protein